MPKAMEKKLKAEAKAKGLTGEKADAYVYGTMNKLGFMDGNKVTAKGKKAESKRKSKKKPVKKAAMKKKK